MKLSIIVPMYNVEMYIEECLDSIISIASNEIEVILIDDGSTDSTPVIAQKYERDYDYIKLYKYENGGLSIARNRGIEKACGNYVIFLDSDDLLNKNESIKLLAFITNMSYDVIFYNSTVFSSDEVENKRNLSYLRPSELLDRSFSGEKSLQQMLELSNYKVSACMYAVKRECLKNLRFYPGIYHEDNLFTTLLLLSPSVNKVTFKNYIVYNRRVRENSITSVKPKDDHIFGYITVYKELKKCYYPKQKVINPFLLSLLASISETAFLKNRGAEKYINKYMFWSFKEKVTYFGWFKHQKYMIKILSPWLSLIYIKIKSSLRKGI
ncbi:glycosyltransferase family 2 protein [Vibrio crassostreae]|uniref:glycosyltransferase family 2 protein n=1 Tax=Vibrio crassostreae TaxID=246167 RepID=UPI001B307505|nr:glycosyltransferase [Vibrio crassostreae]